MSTSVPFDTNVFFAGGAGLFVEYHDIAKPVYLMAIIKLMTSKATCGLPIDMLKSMSIRSLTEWYLQRKHRNPLKCLDYMHQLDDETADAMLLKLLNDDPSLYRMAPPLNLQLLLAGYHRQGMQFPIYFYTKTEEPSVAEDCKLGFQGIPVTYLHGDLATALSECSQNFTYMISSIDTLTELTSILAGTCSHILLAGDYRYNYKTTMDRELKVDLKNIAKTTPYLRLETNSVCDPNLLVAALSRIAGNADHKEDN